MDDTLIELEHFFQVDFEIKKLMYSLAPSSLEYNDVTSVQKYSDELNDLLIYIFSELKCIALNVFGINSDIMSKIAAMETTVKKEFYSCGFDLSKLKKFYEEYITDMKPDFINKVKQDCVGYSIDNAYSIDSASSLNEVLHYLHSYIINNEEILQSVPLISKKQNIFNYQIQLRGKKIDTFVKIYDLFPTNIDVGMTDMVIVNEKKLIMMVRDRGHALSIEISLTGDNARIEYFIPKLCNIDMINSLPGINKVNEDSIGATGVIEVDINNLAETLFHFISNVPMDSDMITVNRSF